jgi:Domain of unknown function (DUF1707)
MAGDDQRSRWLASDEDRDEALRALQEALVDGRLTTEQHSERVSQVLAARYVAEMEELTVDIPPADRRPARKAESALIQPGRQRTRGVLRSVSLRPRGAVPQELRSGALGGNAEIDLRDALIPAEGLDVRIWAYLGEVTVVVPPKVQVALVATPLLGRVEQSTSNAPAGAPTVRIRAVTLFGDINVRTENPSRPDASA